MEVLLKCLCGQVEGNAGPLSRSLNRRIVCMCRDCQAFAHYLDRVDPMLDHQGGTEIIAIHPGLIRITKGREKLGCVCLSDDGLRRWYTLCCKTPIANTHPRNRLPFAGVHRTVIVLPEPNALGGIYARIHGKGAQGTFRAVVSALRFLTWGLLRGLQAPWPFPNVVPIVGTDSEYAALMERVRAARL